MPDGVLAVLMVAGVVALLLFLARLVLKKPADRSKGRDGDSTRRIPPWFQGGGLGDAF
jgi:hypothetical protein